MYGMRFDMFGNYFLGTSVHETDENQLHMVYSLD